MSDQTPEQPRELDPDEVECDTCPANVGEVCLTPSGAKARTVHIARRRAAAEGRVQRRKRPQPAANRGPSPATAEGRSKGGKRTAQERARRKKEADALAAQRAEEAEALALAEHVDKLAADTLRYKRDRLLVRRGVLDAAQLANSRLIEALQQLARPAGYDDEGHPQTKPVELYRMDHGVRKRVIDADGTPAVREEPDVIGYWSVSQIESLAKSAQAALNGLRLEEGKPTGIFEQQGSGGASEILGEAGVEELLELGRQLLPEKGETGGDE